jgi:hypothetical protein
MAPEKFDMVKFTMELWVEQNKMPSRALDLFLNLRLLGQEVRLHGKQVAGTTIYVLKG